MNKLNQRRGNISGESSGGGMNKSFTHTSTATKPKVRRYLLLEVATHTFTHVRLCRNLLKSSADCYLCCYLQKGRIPVFVGSHFLNKRVKF